MKRNTPTKARWATFTIFLLHGIMVGSWVPHIPLAKERLDVGPAVFGLALLAIAAGAVSAMPLTGAMINRYGSARVILVTGVLFCLAFAGPILSPTLITFVIMGYLLGAFIGSMAAGMVVDHYTVDGVKDWQSIWFAFAGYALVLGILFPFLFRYRHER